MSLPPRHTAWSIVLSAALALSLLAIGSSGASLRAKGRVVSVTLTPSSSFTAAQAAKTKLVCKFSPASKRVVLLLSMKKGSGWVDVRSVSKSGSTKAYTTTVKSLFGSRQVKVGKYRVKVSADANSLSRMFTIRGGSSSNAPGAFSKTAPANGATGQASSVVLKWSSSSGAASYEYCVDTTDNNICDNEWISTDLGTSASYRIRAHGAALYWQVRALNATRTTYADGGSWFSFATVLQPTAGFWLGSGSDGVISYVITFDVTSGGTNVTNFKVTFDNPGCEVVGGNVTATSLFPITNGSFSSASGSPTFSGSFDSSATAHGTSRVTNYTSICGTGDLETASWTATWHGES